LVELQELGIIISLITGIAAPIGLFLLSRHTKRLDISEERAEKALSKEDWKEQKDHIYEKIDGISNTLSTLHAKVEENSSTLKWHELRLSKLNGFSK